MNKLKARIKNWYEKLPCNYWFGPGHTYIHTDGGIKTRSTGLFYDGKPLVEKYSITITTCTKCFQTTKTEFKERY